MTDYTQNEVSVLERYFKAANNGNASAQYNLGMMYAGGDGVEKNVTVAAEWYRKAAEQGHAGACLNLGRMYEKGLGFPKDDVKAAEWYRKAAEHGMGRAQCNLGKMYEEGRGVKKDAAQAMEWYRKAAEQEDSEAQSRLASLSEKNKTARDVGAETDIENIYAFSKNAVECAAGLRHYLVLLKDGSLFAWGDSAHGQTGVSLGGYEAAPTKILNNVISIAAGRYHSAALLADGTVLTWGEGEQGQTGRGFERRSHVPRRVSLPDKADKIYAAGNCTAALLKNGEVWLWGKGDGWPLLSASFLPGKIGTSVSSFCLSSSGFAFLDKDGKLTYRMNTDHIWQPIDFAKHEFINGQPFLSIGIHDAKLFILDCMGCLFELNLISGKGLPDKLGDPVFHDVSEVFAFEYGIFIKHQDGTLMASGYNFRGEINPWILPSDNLRLYERDCYYLPWQKIPASGIVHVASNVGGTLLIDANGRVAVWGGGALRAFINRDVMAGCPVKLIDDCCELSHSTKNADSDSETDSEDDWLLTVKDGDVVFSIPVSHPCFKSNMRGFPINEFKIKNDFLVLKENAVIVHREVTANLVYKGMYEDNVFCYITIIRDAEGKYYCIELTSSRTGKDMTFEFRPVSTSYSGYSYTQPDRSWERKRACDENIEPGFFSTKGVKFEAIQLRECKTLALSDDGTLWIFGQDYTKLLQSNILMEERLRPTPVQWGVKKIITPYKIPMPHELILFKDGSLWEYCSLLSMLFGTSSRRFPFACPVKDICSGYELVKNDDGSETAEGESFYALLENGQVYTWMRNGCEAMLPMLTDEIEYYECRRSNDKEEGRESTEYQDNIDSLRRDMRLCQESKPYEALLMEGVDSFIVDGEYIIFVSADKKELYRIRDARSGMFCPDARVSEFYELDENGNLYSVGKNERDTDSDAETDKPLRAFVIENINRVATNGEDTVVLTRDGKLVSWGENKTGCLGTGDKQKHSTPQSI